MSTLPLKMASQLEVFRENKDRRYIFLDCYSRMTRNMLAGVEENAFEDGVWVGRLLHRFAEYYFEAVDAYDRQPESASLVWQVAHRSAAHPRTGPLQLLLLGVNAHINYDLVLALIDLLGPEWDSLSSEKCLSRHRDHGKVNEIIAATIDEVQDEVLEKESPDLALIDDLMGRLDEWLISKIIRSWREGVWKTATNYLEMNNLDLRAAVIEDTEAKALVISKRMLGSLSKELLPAR